MNLIYYLANRTPDDIDQKKSYPLHIEYIESETDDALLICVEKATFGSIIEKEIKIWFPKSAVEGGENLSSRSRVPYILVKGNFFARILSGAYDSEI